MVTIAVIAMGEMGSAVARRLIEGGARVVSSLAGRSAASIGRAKAACVELLNDRELIDQAEIFLSIVPPSSAAATAQRFLHIIERASNKPVFIDCNAIAPQTLHDIAKPFVQGGLPLGDASIIGGPPRPGYTPRLYMSGPIAREANKLKDLGIETRVISDALGDASALKMAYAGVTKGLQAIGASMALGAARAGAAKSFVAELKDSQPALYAWLAKMIPSMYAKAYRWGDEMREISRFLEPERGAADMLTGAAVLYQHVAEDNRIGPQSEILSILNRFVEPQS
jgi:L-threonate 2-dehydrogenase